MQHHQPTRSTPPVLRSQESYESQLSPSSIFPNVAAVSVTSNPRPSIDLPRLDSARSLARTEYIGTSLSAELQDRATTLAHEIQDRPSAFVAHTELIKILHEGFKNHVYPVSSPGTNGDPRSYDLLRDLRMAREHMHKLFAMGEDLWMDCLTDESMLAATNDDKINVTNKCLDAISEEYGSVKLWKIYGDWMYHCYKTAQNPSSNAGSPSTEQDRLLSQATFTWDLVLDTWQQAADNTRLRMSDGHIIWDQYLDLLKQHAESERSSEAFESVKEAYEKRLQMPHSTWDNTSQNFSSFISSSRFSDDWEDLMTSTTRSAGPAKARWTDRESFETTLQSAQEQGGGDAEWVAFSNYIQWEKSSERGRRPEFKLINAIYQQAELRFPSDATLWSDHILWLVEKSSVEDRSQIILSTLDRATRHCPWSGALWSQYLLTSEKERHPFSETESIKHKATSTGLLDVSGIEDVLQVHVAWCGYLRRRAFTAGASDEELDVAEMGIRSSIENVLQFASKLGLSPGADSQFRLERIYIKLLTDSQSWDSAKEAFQGYVQTFGNSTEFWLRFYDWEMMRWRSFVADPQSNQMGKGAGPQFATAVLRQALKQPELDRPEEIMRKLIAHCEDYEDVDELQQSVIEVKKAEKLLAAKKGKELPNHQAIQATDDIEWNQDNSQARKRKLSDGDYHLKHSKRQRNEAIAEPMEEIPEALKRDREHATIVVSNIAETTNDTKIRQFFRDCGTINTVKRLQDQTNKVLVEFEDKSSAEFALSRSGRDLDGSIVEVELEVRSTLFVTNYPPAFGEDDVRNTFSKYGPIVDIRMPSLVANAGRRFCYVQFKTSEDAQRALEMNGTELEPGLVVSVHISDPDQKQHRSGPAEEGRQLFVRNLPFKASEQDLDRLFSNYGEVESVKMPLDDKGRKKGYAFLTLASIKAADAALELDGQDYMGRPVQISIARARKPGTKFQAVSHTQRSESPSTNGISSPWPSTTKEERRERTIALSNVPDTVNVNRIRVLAEMHGDLLKVNLQPLHQGAIIEYRNSASAGKAALALEGFEITSGRTLHVVTVPQMLKQDAEKKDDKIKVGKKATGLQPTQVKRPALSIQRRGGKVGQKNLPIPKDVDTKMRNGDAGRNPKSNNDFKALLQKRDV